MQRRFQLVGSRGGSPVGPPGVILVITLLLVGLFLVMGLTMINLASSDYQVANNESRSIQALYNADSGIEEAKMRVSPNAPITPIDMRIGINPAANWRAYVLSGHTQAEIQAGLDPNYSGAATNAFFPSVQAGTNTIPWGWARIEHKLDGGNIVYQDVLTGANTTSASQMVGTTTVYNPPILIVTAEGIQGSVRRMVQVEYQPIVNPSTSTDTNEVVTNPFSNAAHGRSSVALIGNTVTNSYDSRNGAYGGSNSLHRGHVGTDATGSDSVIINPNATVDGTVYVGPGLSPPDSAVSNSGTITGTPQIDNEPSVWNLPPATVPAGVTNSGALSISGNRVVTLTEGTYWYTSLSITGNGQLQTSGRVKIYVSGNIDIGGNGYAAAGNLPPNLLIYGTSATTSVSIHGNGNMYGAVYAPSANLTVTGNGNVFGALTGNTVTLNGNGLLVYDEALGQLDQTVTTNTTTTTTYTMSGYSRYSWREVAF